MKKLHRMLCALFSFGDLGERAEARKEDPPELQNVVVVGAGTMGKQIAVQCAGHGYDVTLYDVDSDVLSRVKDQAAGIVDWLSAHGHIQHGERGAILDRIEVESS